MSPRVVTAAQAVAQGIGPGRLRGSAAWSFEAAQRAEDPIAAERHRAQADALMRVADEVEQQRRAPVRRSRRHAA